MYENTDPIRKVINYWLEKGFSWVLEYDDKEVDFMRNSFKSTATYFVETKVWHFSYQPLIDKVSKMDKETGTVIKDFIDTKVKKHDFIGHCFEALARDACGEPVRKCEPDEKSYLRNNRNMLDGLPCGQTGKCQYMRTCAYAKYLYELSHQPNMK
jgi:hypothetical protein